MTRRRGLARRIILGELMRLIGRGLIAAAGLFVLWAGGLVWFAESIPSSFADDTRRTDAIVVLTGGPLRLKTGLAMFNEGRARKVFVSGVYRTVDVAELLRAAQQTPETVACCIVLGHAADSTTGNALETRDWMAREGYKSLRLVTANYHIKRSLLEFRRAMPEAAIVPHPVFPEGFKREAWWRWPGTLSLVVGEYHKYLAALVRPLIGGSGEAPQLEP